MHERVSNPASASERPLPGTRQHRNAEPASGLVRLDAHHHLWHYTPAEYDWIDTDMQALRRDFLLDDLRAELSAAGVVGTVAVQARQTLAETDWLLDAAERADSPILGVVGWLPLMSSNLGHLLSRYGACPKLKGVRHVVQAEPDDFLDNERFLGGVSALDGAGLAYDLLIYARQLTEAIRFVDRFPRQRFVLDHIAKPNIRTGAITTWSRNFRELARRPNVACKLSGMVTEADPRQWSPQQLEPFVDVVLNAFGAERVMAGTDWPVLTLGCDYAQWWRLIEGWLGGLSTHEQAAILGGTATAWYRLEPAPV